MLSQVDTDLLQAQPWDVTVAEQAIKRLQALISERMGTLVAASCTAEAAAAAATTAAAATPQQRALLQVYVAVLCVSKAGCLVQEHGITAAYLYVLKMVRDFPRIASLCERARAALVTAYQGMTSSAASSQNQDGLMDDEDSGVDHPKQRALQHLLQRLAASEVSQKRKVLILGHSQIMHQLYSVTVHAGLQPHQLDRAGHFLQGAATVTSSDLKRMLQTALQGCDCLLVDPQSLVQLKHFPLDCFSAVIQYSADEPASLVDVILQKHFRGTWHKLVTAVPVDDGLSEEAEPMAEASMLQTSPVPQQLGRRAYHVMPMPAGDDKLEAVCGMPSPPAVSVHQHQGQEDQHQAQAEHLVGVECQLRDQHPITPSEAYNISEPPEVAEDREVQREHEARRQQELLIEAQEAKRKALLDKLLKPMPRLAGAAAPDTPITPFPPQPTSNKPFKHTQAEQQQRLPEIESKVVEGEGQQPILGIKNVFRDLQPPSFLAPAAAPAVHAAAATPRPSVPAYYQLPIIISNMRTSLVAQRRELYESLVDLEAWQPGAPQAAASRLAGSAVQQSSTEGTKVQVELVERPLALADILLTPNCCCCIWNICAPIDVVSPNCTLTLVCVLTLPQTPMHPSTHALTPPHPYAPPHSLLCFMWGTTPCISTSTPTCCFFTGHQQ